MKRWLALSLLVAGPALAGPYDQPWSIVLTDARPSVDTLYRPVFVNRVDEQNSIDNQVITTPGRHTLTLDVPARKGFSTTQQSFEVELSPCTRYYYGAQLKSQATQAWTPVIRRQEAIPECHKQFNIPQPKA